MKKIIILLALVFTTATSISIFAGNSKVNVKLIDKSRQEYHNQFIWVFQVVSDKDIINSVELNKALLLIKGVISVSPNNMNDAQRVMVILDLKKSINDKDIMLAFEKNGLVIVNKEELVEKKK